VSKKRIKRRKQDWEKLRIWQDRLAQSNMEYAPLTEKMNRREARYNGDRRIEAMVKADAGKNESTPHVRNIIFENIESQVSTSIPQPKVTPRRKKDEHLADIIECFLRNELDRQKFEAMNDMAERTVPIQGGTGWMVEWDNQKRSHSTVGEPSVCLVHPKQLAPQPGIYTGVADMDWVIVKLPTTKETVWRKYGINVWTEGESEPEVRSSEAQNRSEDALTQYVGFAKNRSGGIDRFSWVNDVVLEDLENYQARRQPVCANCGRVRPHMGQVISNDVQKGNLLPDPETGFAGNLLQEMAAGHSMAHQVADAYMDPAKEGAFLEGVELGREEPKKYDGGSCPWCGADKWDSREQEYEEILLPVRTQEGNRIPGIHGGLDEMGNPIMVPTKVPYYRPDCYPLIIQKSVSIFGQLWGNSDVDAIEDQQNTINRLEKKIIDRIVKAGTRITLPPKANFKMDPEDGERWYLEQPSDKAMIGVYEFTGNLQYELMYLSQVYEESRQILGITDSFQGRKDPTATSGKAKEYSAAMAAGRLESKRVMKQAAYADIFEMLFKYELAYADEPRTVTKRDHRGNQLYMEFNRYDFLERDANGEWHWNDQFLFSCDTSGPLASNREAMWQETRMNLQTGAFGDPAATETLVLFWTKMELLHYPGAGQTKAYLEEKLQREQAQMQRMQQMQLQQAQGAGIPAGLGAAGQIIAPK
jgi:hypothetical protein